MNANDLQETETLITYFMVQLIIMNIIIW